MSVKWFDVIADVLRQSSYAGRFLSLTFEVGETIRENGANV